MEYIPIDQVIFLSLLNQDILNGHQRMEQLMELTIIMILMFLYFSMDTIFNLNKFIGILKL